MTEHAPPLPSSLDPLIAEAKRRTTVRRVLLATAALLFVAGIAAATVELRAPSGGFSPAHRYTFTVNAVNSSRLVNATKYVSIVSPVVLSRRKLAHTPLFNVSGEFHLTKAPAAGPVLCSFAKKVAHSTTFPSANGKTVTIRVYGERSPGLTDRICRAFNTFSLSWLYYEKLRATH